jgi:hypothetical protein
LSGHTGRGRFFLRPAARWTEAIPGQPAGASPASPRPASADFTPRGRPPSRADGRLP